MICLELAIYMHRRSFGGKFYENKKSLKWYRFRVYSIPILPIGLLRLKIQNDIIDEKVNIL